MTDLKPKILSLTSSYPRWAHGSAGSFIYHLNRHLSNRYDITVSAPHARGAAILESMDQIEVRRFRYWFPSGENLCYDAGLLANLRARPWRYLQLPVFFVLWLWSAVRLVRKIKPDFIHAHWLLPAGFVAAAVSRITGTPFIVTIHGSDLMKLSAPVFNRLYRFTLDRASGVTVVSQAMQQKLVPLLPAGLRERVLCQAMGVDVSEFASRSGLSPSGLRGEPSILFVGWLDYNKGLEHLFQSLPGLLLRYPGAVVQVVGEGPRRHEFEKIAKDQRFRGHVVFHGLVPHEMMPDIYRAAQLFVLPSLSEGVPVSVMEAMAAGCPVVATSVGGTPDIVIHNETGLLVEPASPKSLTHAMLTVLDDPGLRQRLVQSARTFVQSRYDWPIVAGRFEKYFESIFLDNH